MVRLGLDMMGGDFAPLEAVKGAAAYLKNNGSNVHVFMIGDEVLINSHLKNYVFPQGSYTIVPTTDIVPTAPVPTTPNYFYYLC